MRLPPARTLPIATTTASGLLVGGASILTFYGFTETTGAAGAEVELIDGDGTSGAVIVNVTLQQGESTRDLIPAPCLNVRTGLYLHVVSGSIKGSVWIVPAELAEPFELTQGEHPVWRGES